MKKMITQCLVTLCFLGSFTVNAQKKVIFDNSFGKKGTHALVSDSSDYSIYQSFPLASGGSVSFGFAYGDTTTNMVFFKLDAQGKPDVNFGKKGTVSINTDSIPDALTTVYKMIETTDKSILVLFGDGNSFIDAESSAVIRISKTGKIDNNFAGGTGSLAPTTDASPGGIADIEPLANGKFLALSIFSNATQKIFSNFVQYNANGTIDNTFGNNGVALVLKSDAQAFITMNKVGTNFILSGVELDFDPNATTFFTPLLTKVNKKGKIDAKFGIPILKNSSTNKLDIIPIGVKIAPDSSFIYTASIYDNDADSSYYEVHKIKANGQVDSSFAKNGTLKLEPEFAFGFDVPLKGIELLNDGSLMTFFPADIDANEMTATLYDKKGALDKKFGDDGVSMFQVEEQQCIVTNSHLQADGKIIISGIKNNPAMDYLEAFVSRLEVVNSVATVDASLINAKLNV